MILPYFQNLCGASLDEEQFQDIKHPYVELYTHVTIKTLQLGTTFGTVVFGPLIALARKNTRNAKGLSLKMSRAGMVGAAIGAFAGPAMTYQKIKDQSEELVYDRSYRIRKNCTQVKSDQGYFLGGIFGVAASTVIKASPVFGGLVGMSAGLIGVGIYNNLPKK